MAAANGVPVLHIKRSSDTGSVNPVGFLRQAVKPAAAGVPLGLLSMMCYSSSICMSLLHRDTERRSALALRATERLPV